MENACDIMLTEKVGCDWSFLLYDYIYIEIMSDHGQDLKEETGNLNIWFITTA